MFTYALFSVSGIAEVASVEDVSRITPYAMEPPRVSRQTVT